MAMRRPLTAAGAGEMRLRGRQGECHLGTCEGVRWVACDASLSGPASRQRRPGPPPGIAHPRPGLLAPSGLPAALEEDWEPIFMRAFTTALRRIMMKGQLRFCFTQSLTAGGEVKGRGRCGGRQGTRVRLVKGAALQRSGEAAAPMRLLPFPAAAAPPGAAGLLPPSLCPRRAPEVRCSALWGQWSGTIMMSIPCCCRNAGTEPLRPPSSCTTVCGYDRSAVSAGGRHEGGGLLHEAQHKRQRAQPCSAHLRSVLHLRRACLPASLPAPPVPTPT